MPVEGHFCSAAGKCLSKYPGQKHQRFVLDSSFFVRLLQTYHPPSISDSKKLTVLEVPESHCSGLLAAVQSGYGYLGYQPHTKILKWLLSDGVEAIKNEVTEDQ